MSPAPIELINSRKNNLRHTHHVRTLFWLAYVLDTELSIRTGQPPAIQDEHCDLTLPVGYEAQLNALLSSDVSDDMFLEGPLYQSDLRVVKIKSRAYRTLYSPGVINKSDAELVKLIRELDSDLEAWRLSIPAKQRPSLSSTSQKQLENLSLVETLPMMLWMDYFHSMAIIHHAAGRCKAWAGDEMNMMDVIGSSFALAVETSRSCIRCLESTLSVLPPGIYWYVVRSNLSRRFPPTLRLWWKYSC